MNISEIKSLLHLADAFVVGYDTGESSDFACLTIGRIERDNNFRILKCLHGAQAIKLYHSLVDIY